MRARLVGGGVGIDEREAGALGEARGDARELRRVAIGDRAGRRDEQQHRGAAADGIDAPSVEIDGARAQPKREQNDRDDVARAHATSYIVCSCSSARSRS